VTCCCAATVRAGSDVRDTDGLLDEVEHRDAIADRTEHRVAVGREEHIPLPIDGTAEVGELSRIVTVGSLC
jgi:hypothetical protein